MKYNFVILMLLIAQLSCKSNENRLQLKLKKFDNENLISLEYVLDDSISRRCYFDTLGNQRSQESFMSGQRSGYAYYNNKHLIAHSRYHPEIRFNKQDFRQGDSLTIWYSNNNTISLIIDSEIEVEHRE